MRKPAEAPIPSTTGSATRTSPVDLLGSTRAEILRLCRDHGGVTVTELADTIGISQAAIRKHVDRLVAEGLLEGEEVRRGRGRPATRWSPTPAGRALFPNRTDELASELLGFLAASGREDLGAFLRWRQERQVDALADEVDADDVAARVEQLADALSRHGFHAEATRDGDGFVLRQTHCAIERAAREQPLLCAHEAAAFGRVLGEDVRVTRRRTLARGDDACVCHVQVRDELPNSLPVLPVTSPTTSCSDGPPGATGRTDAVAGDTSTTTIDLPPATDLPTTTHDEDAT